MAGFVRKLVKSRLLVVVAAPVAARAATLVADKLEQSRGPSGTTRALRQGADFLRPQPKRRGPLARLLRR